MTESAELVTYRLEAAVPGDRRRGAGGLPDAERSRPPQRTVGRTAGSAERATATRGIRLAGQGHRARRRRTRGSSLPAATSTRSPTNARRSSNTPAWRVFLRCFAP